MTTTTTTIEKRGHRYQEILPLSKIEMARVFIGGAGAVGRALAIQLATMGVGRIIVCDKDVVEEANLGPQGWHHSQLGMNKVDALADVLRAINPTLDLTIHNEWFKDEMLEDAQYSFSCVDVMEVRRDILLAHAKIPLHFKLYSEARMGSEVCQASFVWNEPSRKRWIDSWYPQHEVPQDGCTAKSTYYCASMAATLLVSGWTKHLRGMLMRPSVHLNLKADEFEAEKYIEDQKTEAVAGSGVVTPASATPGEAKAAV